MFKDDVSQRFLRESFGLQTVDLLLSHKILYLEFNVGQSNEVAGAGTLDVLLGEMPVGGVDQRVGRVLLHQRRLHFSTVMDCVTT